MNKMLLEFGFYKFCIKMFEGKIVIIILIKFKIFLISYKLNVI